MIIPGKVLQDTEFDDKQIQVSITLENGDSKISLEDEDVLAILEGIKIK